MKEKNKRNWFGFDDKIELLKKSDNKCCHCGCLLNERTSTVEHFIPLSKGGSNDFDNLVCLCKDCNDKKSDFIVRPKQYYRYLKDEHIDELNELFDDYNKDISWLTAKNFTKEDVLEFKYPVMVSSLQGHNSKKKGRLYCSSYLYVTATLKKATYDDLDAIFEFTRKYHKKYGLETDHIKDVMTDIFIHDALYILLKQGEIVAVFPVGIKNTTINDYTGLCVSFYGLLCLRPSNDNLELISQVMYYMTGCIAIANPNKVCVISVTLPALDEAMCDLIGEESIYFSEEDEWINFVINIEDTEENGLCTIYEDTDFKERLKKSSRFLKRAVR